MKYQPGFFAFMDSVNEDAKDLTDGAWEAYMRDHVRYYNEANGTRYDDHDGWLAWVKWTSAGEDSGDWPDSVAATD